MTSFAVDFTNTMPTGVNDSGYITGAYWFVNGHQRGFLRDANGKNVVFKVPLAVATIPTAINIGGSITGTYKDAAGLVHGFLRTP
jgi:hypothetical protein